MGSRVERNYFKNNPSGYDFKKNIIKKEKENKLTSLYDIPTWIFGHT